MKPQRYKSVYCQKVDPTPEVIRERAEAIRQAKYERMRNGGFVLKRKKHKKEVPS